MQDGHRGEALGNQVAHGLDRVIAQGQLLAKSLTQRGPGPMTSGEVSSGRTPPSFCQPLNVTSGRGSLHDLPLRLVPTLRNASTEVSAPMASPAAFRIFHAERLLRSGANAPNPLSRWSAGETTRGLSPSVRRREAAGCSRRAPCWSPGHSLGLILAHAPPQVPTI